MVHKATLGFPNKQPLLPSKQFVFSNTQPPNYDYLNTSSKYAELFLNPSTNPNMYSFENPVPAYPLDTVIPNSTYPTPQKTSHDLAGRVGGASNGLGVHFTLGKKGASNSELENLLAMPATKAVSPSTELENLFKMSDTDFTSLMSTFGPSNSESLERGPADFAIPSASTGIFDSFPAGLFTDRGSSPPSSASPPTTAMMTQSQQQQSMDTWRSEGEKWGGGMNFATNSPPGEMDTPGLWSSSPLSSTSHSELTPLLEAFPPLDRDLPLPSSSSSSPHSHFHTPSVSPSRSTPTNLPTQNHSGNSLSFEEQLDFFDSPLEWDGILPPMKRRQESPLSHSEASSPVSHMHISPAPTPAPSSPPSPIETKPIITSLPSSSSFSAEKSAKSSPLLFGQSEHEILVKVLAHQPSPDSKPVTREKLVSMSVEEFNRLLDMATLNEIEVAFMKEWRRRGKNKTAAMVARKRKRDELTDLDEEVEQLRKQKTGLRSKYEQLRAEIVALKQRSKVAEEKVYRRYSRQSGVHVSRDTHVIHVDKSGKVLLGPRLSPQQMLLVK